MVNVFNIIEIILERFKSEIVGFLILIKNYNNKKLINIFCRVVLKVLLFVCRIFFCISFRGFGLWDSLLFRSFVIRVFFSLRCRLWREGLIFVFIVLGIVINIYI